MKPEFRRIPLTIIDFLAVFLPGFVWTLLFIITYWILIPPDNITLNTPFEALSYLCDVRYSENPSTFLFIALFVAALTIGYSLKPIAVKMASPISKPALKMIRDYRVVQYSELKFPFNAVYCSGIYEESSKTIKKVLESKLKCSLNSTPGKQPFSAAKRYLRLVSPDLWEESERAEAEVRMLAALFLASFYNLIFILSILILRFNSVKNLPDFWLWLVLSIISVLLLAIGYNFTRDREIRYTYDNVLLASL